MTLSFLMSSSLFVGVASAQTLAIVDANGYISATTAERAKASAEVNVEVHSDDVLHVNSTTSTRDGDEYAKETKQSSSSSDTSMNEESTPTDMSIMAHLQTWGHKILVFLGLRSSTNTEMEQVVKGEVTTTSSSAHIVWPGYLTGLVHVYYGTTTPLVISSTTPYVTSWGIGHTAVDVTGLQPSTKYYYRVTTFSLGDSTTTLQSSFTTK